MLGFQSTMVERALEIRKDAADERDAAGKRLEDHKRSCGSVK
jgi:hypothetical protein